ncbi:MAG TPA: DUF1648 domain-containing protein [Candidatus Acidoferrum sp.]|nr:DUF1648 domain-containing protein [Candidatus Acidoferrum sp.]
MDSRLPKLIFFLLVLYAAVHFSYYYPQLPGVVASHFNARGAANSWQTKSAFFKGFVAVSVLATLIGFGLPRLIEVMPVSLVNLPNKKYWLAPERMAETKALLTGYFAWFACVIYVVVILTFDFAVKYNLHAEPLLDPTRLWYILAGFLVFTIVWIIRVLAKFLRPPRESS